MINFHYIINFDLLNKEDINYIIQNIIFKYSYPCCKNTNNILTEEDKFKINNDEFNFVKNKINEYCKKEIMIFQIPRIIYDLFNIYYQIKLYIDNNDIIPTVYNFDYTNTRTIKNNDYNHTNTKEFDDDIINVQNKNIELIININNLAYNKIKKYTYYDPFEFWLQIFNDIIDDIYLYYDKYMITIKNYEDELNHKIILYELKTKPMIHTMKLKSELKKQFKIHNINIFLDSNVSLKNEINKKILINILKIECNNLDSKIVIYRRSEHDLDKCDNDKYISLSYNTSILNGIFADSTACTFTLCKMENESIIDTLDEKEIKKPVYKKYILLSKDFKHNDHEIYFIPPIHPSILLNCFGEYWHVRQKIPNDVLFVNTEGILSSFKNTLQTPEYLKSSFNKKDMERLCKEKQKQVLEFADKYYYKYFKYKLKYLTFFK